MAKQINDSQWEVEGNVELQFTCSCLNNEHLYIKNKCGTQKN